MRISNRPGGTGKKLAGASAMRFLTRTRPGLILLGLAAAAATAAVPTSASASTLTSPVVGYTYVDGNTAPANTIDGFARHADGSLTPLAGSPFSAGGAGLGSGLASQGAIQVTSDGRYLLAVDAGSNQISVLRITANGVPVLVGQPVSSGGITPVPTRLRGGTDFITRVDAITRVLVTQDLICRFCFARQFKSDRAPSIPGETSLMLATPS